MNRYPAALFLILMSVYGLLSTIGGCSRPADESDVFKIGEPQEATFVGSAECKSCHEKAWTDWRASDHFRAMEPANDSTVLGDFNNAVLTADGVTSRFFKRDGKFYIHTQGDDGTYTDFEVLYTFGIYPLQQYLVAFPGGRMQATRASWDSRDKRWFHQYPGQEIHHRDWLHWTGNGQNWNTMCASCHSTDLQKNYDAGTDSYATTWAELNVSCETCHGPGSRHIDYINSAAYKRGERLPRAALWYGRDTITQLQLNTCAACHARKADIAQAVMRTDEIMDDLIPQVISTDFYYADGQIREEDYEYGSFTQSKMFHQNVRCSQCHNPHSGKTYHAGNTLCLQCHKPEYDSPQHHFHKPDTEAALCVNCHMTVRTYMGNDHRRDHSFRVPRPDQSVRYDTPNACTGCHKEKLNAWAAEAVKKWYGPERKHHFSDDLLPGSQLDADSEAPLVRLLADTAQPAIARATAAYYLGSINGLRSTGALQKALADSQAIVRYYALRALANFPPEAWQQAAAGSLRDPVRAVRIAAADLYHALPAANIPAAAREDFGKADAENRAYLAYQADFACRRRHPALRPRAPEGQPDELCALQPGRRLQCDRRQCGRTADPANSRGDRPLQ